jgi:hypothetical protein
MSVKFRVRNIRAVGMHHYGATELQKNVPYTFQWEPMCVYDLGNAIAIQDYRGDTRGYVTREDSAVLSELFFSGSIVGRMVGKTRVDGHVCRQELGPQQECTVVFRVDKEREGFVSYFLTTKSLLFDKS